MHSFWKVSFVVVLCGYLAGCAGSTGPATTGEPSLARAGTPSVVLPQTHFRIQDVSGDAEITHDFAIRNAGSGILEITKITPG